MFSDLRYAFRQLVKNPGFAGVAILTLALGIGACTAIFSVVNGVLLRPLDFPQPDRIVVIRETNLPQFPEFSVSPPNYLDWAKQTKSWQYLAAYSGVQVNLTGEGEPQRLVGVGMANQGFDRAVPFEREPAADDPRAAWIFEGVPEGPIGDPHPVDAVGPGIGSPPRAEQKPAWRVRPGRARLASCQPTKPQPTTSPRMPPT